MTPRDYFAQKGYVYLTNILSKEKCAKLTEYMFSLYNDGKLTKDEQCPKSDSVYGDPVLDNVLASLVDPLSNQLGIQLLPTYTYARIYRPGEILKHHIDRESCEISATVTLGVDPMSEIWPIFLETKPGDKAGTQICIDVGDGLLYRGAKMDHWRPEYKGMWQVQVFFHFVDANGPNKDFKFDKRPELGLAKNATQTNLPREEMVKIVEQTIRPHIHNGVMIPSWDKTCPGATTFDSKFKPQLAFTKAECNQIVEFAKHKYPKKSKVGTDERGGYDPNVRRVDEYTIELSENTKWIFDKVATAVSIANHEYYKFEIMGITHALQLLNYREDEKGFYDWHVDIGNGEAATRKISISVMLTDPSEYEGGDLILNNFGSIINSSREQGSINLFPSYLPHTVTPVTKGSRWVLVIWVHGSQRFK